MTSVWIRSVITSLPGWSLSIHSAWGAPPSHSVFHYFHMFCRRRRCHTWLCDSAALSNLDRSHWDSIVLTYILFLKKLQSKISHCCQERAAPEPDLKSPTCDFKPGYRPTYVYIFSLKCPSARYRCIAYSCSNKSNHRPLCGVVMETMAWQQLLSHRRTAGMVGVESHGESSILIRHRSRAERRPERVRPHTASLSMCRISLVCLNNDLESNREVWKTVTKPSFIGGINPKCSRFIPCKINQTWVNFEETSCGLGGCLIKLCHIWWLLVINPSIFLF